MYHSNLSVEIKQNDDFHPRTMETTWYKVKCGNTFLNIHVIYRPPNGSVIDFCEEMTTLLETTILDVNEPIFCGDFNIHAEDISNFDTIIFYGFLDSFNLTNKIIFSTHKSGHTLDLVLVEKNSKLDYMLKQGHMITDHNFIHFYCELPSMERSERWINCRRLKDIDENAFAKDISNSFNNELGNSTSDIVNTYNKVLREILDKYAPSKKTLVKQSHNQPWFNTKIRNEIKLRRKMECDWNRDQTEYSYIVFVYQ